MQGISLLTGRGGTFPHIARIGTKHRWTQAKDLVKGELGAPSWWRRERWGRRKVA